MDSFNTIDYICKFFFLKIDHIQMNEYRQRISADLYLQELKIEIINSNDEVVAVYGYPLENKLKTLLPLIRWEEFEKTRDISGWNLKHDGYRDGWGYEFKCMNECGKPLITNYLNVTFNRKDKPAYEILLNWVITNFSQKRALKEYKLDW